MRGKMYRKVLVLGIILLFVGASVITGISEDIRKDMDHFDNSRGGWAPGKYKAYEITEQKMIDNDVQLQQTSPKNTNEPLFFIEPGPNVKSRLYADGSIIELQTEAVARPICGSNPGDMTQDEFKTMVQSRRKTNKNDNKIVISGESRDGLNIVYNSGSGIPPGGDAAMDALATYIENLFDDPITVSIDVSFADLPSGILGWTYLWFTSTSWINTRNGLINGMDSDDFIQNWLPIGSTIPVRYNYYSSTVTNENTCYFTRANYRATIGSISGLASEVEFNTDYTWDVDPSNGVSGFCFQSVLAHETGHGLGFISNADAGTSDIEALDIFRFQRSDGSGDYNPDTLTEFQTTPRMVDLDNGNVNNDVNSDLIPEENPGVSSEWRMSDGDPYQASHFHQGLNPEALMEPTRSPGETLWPNFFRIPDIDMFDAIGWDYSPESGTTMLPFFDDFPDTTIDINLWTGVEDAEINDIGINEPSSPYSMNLEGSYSGGDKIRTAKIDTSGLPGLKLEYYYQRTGGGNPPEAGEDLVIEYYNNTHDWVEINRHLGDGPDMTTYNLETLILNDADVFHEDFRVQFRAISSNDGFDDWFIDNINIDEVSYTLITSVVGNGSITPTPDQSTYSPGTKVTLEAFPDQDWTFDHWSGNLSGDINPDTIIMDGDKTVTAHFTQDQYILTVNTVGNGSVDLDPPGGSYPLDTSVELTAVADPGWSFDHWSGDLSGSANPDTIIMDDDKTVTAHFTQDQYILTVNTVGNGSVVKDPNQTTYSYGSVVELTANADPGWSFSHWDGDLAGNDNPDTIVMDSNKIITAVFEQPAIISIMPSDQTVEKGEIFTVDVYVDAAGNQVKGIKFETLYYNASLIHATYDNITNPGGVVFNGWFAPGATMDSVFLDLTYADNVAGELQVVFESRMSGSTINNASWVTIEFQAQDNLSTSYLNLDGVEIIDPGYNPLPYTVNNGSVIVEEYVFLEMFIDGSGTTDPSGSPTGDLHSYPWGTNVTLTATPDPCWEFAGWSGDKITTDNPTYIIMDDNKSVTATFNGLMPEITNVINTTSEPKDTDPDYGWENFSCTVTDDDGIDTVKLVLIGDTTTEYPMNKDGDDYYCNISLSIADKYIYHIWANDTTGNENTSSPQSFDMPMNEDVNMDGSVGFVDIMMVAGMWNVEGPNGWDRSDVDNSGVVGFVDIMMVAGRWGQEW